MGELWHIIPRQTGTTGEFLYSDGGGGQASSSAACTCIFALQAQTREHQVFAPTHIQIANPVETFTTNISSQNTAMFFVTQMLSLLKIQRLPVLATYVPQAPSRSQTHFSCPRSQAVFAKTSQRGCFSRVISRNTKSQDTEVPTQDKLRTWSQNYSTQWAHFTSHSCTLYCQSQGLKSHEFTLLQK